MIDSTNAPPSPQPQPRPQRQRHVEPANPPPPPAAPPRPPLADALAGDLNGISRVTTERDDAIVERIEDNLYRDYSQVTPEDVLVSDEVGGVGGWRDIPSSLLHGGDGGTGGGGIHGSRHSTDVFPLKLHDLLSDPDAEGIIAWLPHGRAWRVLDADELEERGSLLARHFRHGRVRSFMRQVNGWGFRRVPRGRDAGAYYHQLFLRGMPHLCFRMVRIGANTRRSECRSIYSQLQGITPDFYRISEQFPLPPRAPLTRTRQGLVEHRVAGTTTMMIRSSHAEAMPERAPSSMSSSESLSTVVSSSSSSSSSSFFATVDAVPSNTILSSSGLANEEPPAIHEESHLHPIARRRLSPSSIVALDEGSEYVRRLRGTSTLAVGGEPLHLAGGAAAAVAVGRRDIERPISPTSVVGVSSSVLAAEALQGYILRNAIMTGHSVGQTEVGEGAPTPPQEREGHSGGDQRQHSSVALAGREIFLRHLRERADLIDNLRSIMYGTR